MRHGITFAIACCGLLFSTLLRAEPPPADGEESEGHAAFYVGNSSHSSEPTREWYGWQTLLLDGTSLIVLPAVSVGADSSAPFALGMIGYVAGGPFVHTAHDNGLEALSSLGVRVGLPVLGGVVGRAAADCSNSNGFLNLCPLAQVVAGIYIGMLTAAAVDASLLAYEEQSLDESSAVQIVPQLNISQRDAQFSIVGAF